MAFDATHAYDGVLQLPGVTPFAPGSERPMGTWVVVNADVIADDPELAALVALALQGVRQGPEPTTGKPRSRRR